MELENLRNTWAEIDQKLERNWKLNLELVKRTNIDKSKNNMKNLVWVKAIGLIFYFIFAGLFIAFAISNWNIAHMAIAGLTLAVWAIAICIASIHELELITRIDYSLPISDLQKTLSGVRMAIIKYLRLGVWIAPLYFAFIILLFKTVWDLDIVAVGDETWIYTNVVLSITFIPLAVWAHRKLSPRNAETRWMNNLLRGNGSQITSALILIKEIEEFEKEV